MGHLFDKRKKAEKHIAKKGENLAGIADKYKGKEGAPADLTWEDLAYFNWATTDAAEVTRALCERIGSANSEAVRMGANPESLILDPQFGPSSPEPILIPKLWKSEELQLDKKYTVEVMRRKKACSIGITNLDKWFIPAVETCDIEYQTLGEKAYADEVIFEVYASNYAKMTDWKNGLPEFSALDGVPVYKSKREDGETSINWDGLSNCSEGALKPAGHPMNVAFSPYTALLRYTKAGMDATARIDLDPFWVTFGKDDKPKADSCKVSWKLKNADRATVGLLQISDKTGSVIFAKGLNKKELDAGSFAWDGKDSVQVQIISAGMPYRVRLEAHTDIDEAQGLALAAMQTEVRLYVHPLTYPLDQANYDGKTDKMSLDVGLADVYHKDQLPTRGDGSLWTKYHLAKAGFHPGPVFDAAENDDFKCARNEFQRSVPKHGGVPGAYERMPIGPDNSDTKDALQNLAAARRRPWFGKPADLGDHVDFNWQPQDWPDITAGDFLTRFRDPKERMIVWVDDRNWYTDGIYWKHGFYDHQVIVDDRNLFAVHSDPADLGGHSPAGRGSFEHRDDRVDKDARDIARPWIPLQVDFRLLSKENNLDEEIPQETEAGTAEAMRKAIGPLRVDWTFDEIETTENVLVQGGMTMLPKLDRESETLFGMLGGGHSRTRIALRWTMDQTKSAPHARRDVNKTCTYYNAKTNVGGLRGAEGDYFETAFAKPAESLAPWTTAKSDRESMYCVVHDRVGQNDSDVYAKRLGRAGVYFHPSRIAGDGYQVRAQVFFKATNGYAFPNVSTLAARYPKYPQAHTVQFRLWRKTSIRAYIKWGTADNWNNPQPRVRPNYPPQGPLGFRSYYTACHVHICNELNAANLDHPIGTVFTQQTYRALVEHALSRADPQYAYRNDIQFSTTRCWPWSNHDFLGFAPSAPNQQLADDKGAALNQGLMLHVRLAFRYSLAMVQSVERETGRMRGHVLVEYQSTDKPYWLQYVCPNCHSTYTITQRQRGVLAGLLCPSPGCINQALRHAGLRSTHSNPCADGVFDGLNTPSCGFPIGVFWNFLGTADLWAHELGHNRHYEHAADAFGLPDRWNYHYHQPNSAFIGRQEKAENTCWDRSCLMSYIGDVLDSLDASSYDQANDIACLCFKCVLRNRGWRLDPVANPPSGVTD
jgi:hypothetical protein